MSKKNNKCVIYRNQSYTSLYDTFINNWTTIIIYEVLNFNINSKNRV